jgi:hypothetical protein
MIRQVTAAIVLLGLVATPGLAFAQSAADTGGDLAPGGAAGSGSSTVLGLSVPALEGIGAGTVLAAGLAIGLASTGTKTPISTAASSSTSTSTSTAQ